MVDVDFRGMTSKIILCLLLSSQLWTAKNNILLQSQLTLIEMGIAKKVTEIALLVEQGFQETQRSGNTNKSHEQLFTSR